MIHAIILVLHGYINKFLFFIPTHHVVTLTSMFFTISPLLIRDKKARKAKGKGRFPRGNILICHLHRAKHHPKREKKREGEILLSHHLFLIISNLTLI